MKYKSENDDKVKVYEMLEKKVVEYSRKEIK
jgi:hypothetical protein